MRTTTLLTAAVATLGLTAACLGQEAGAQETRKLTIGDSAPALDIAHWIKGDQLIENRELQPISEFEDGKVYVVEFWATWCGPCVASMPHLSELAERYADYGVTFIGVSDEPLPTVIDFMFKTNQRDGKVNNERMRYVVTTDPDESVKNDYFRAAGRRGIPCAFIVGKDAKVEWIGHPMSMDEPLEQIVRDQWDRTAFKSEFEGQATRQQQAQDLSRKLAEARQAKDWPTVLKLLDEMAKQQPENVQVRIDTFMTLLRDMNTPSLAYQYGGGLVRDHWDDHMLLNQIAWYVVDTEGIETRDTDFAMKAAMRANELSNGRDAAILDTVARVHYESGDLDEAIEWQKKAVKHAGDDQLGDGVRETLRKYMQEKADEG